MSEHSLDSEIRPRAIVGFGVGLIVVTVAVSALMWWLSLGLRAHLESDDPAPAALPEARLQAAPEGPLLQSDPLGDLERMRAEEDGELNRAEWTDESSRVARLPIDIALEAVAAIGELPSVATAEAETEDL